MRRLGSLEWVVVLTGDHRDAAPAIWAEPGVEEVHADLVPAGKVERVEAPARPYGAVATVGEGVNGASAFATAAVGVGMGAAG